MGRATTQEVMRILKRIKKEAGKKINIDKFLLFGSRARGEELLSSDVDLIVISRDFEGVPFRQRPDIFLDLWRLSVDFEVLCYTPEEIVRKRKEIGLVREALRYAVEV